MEFYTIDANDLSGSTPIEVCVLNLSVSFSINFPDYDDDR